MLNELPLSVPMEMYRETNGEYGHYYKDVKGLIMNAKLFSWWQSIVLLTEIIFIASPKIRTSERLHQNQQQVWKTPWQKLWSTNSKFLNYTINICRTLHCTLWCLLPCEEEFQENFDQFFEATEKVAIIVITKG